MKIIKIVAGICFAAILFSCGKSYKERAAEKFTLAADICQKGDTAIALRQLDSILMFFPEAFATIEKAKSMSRKINSEILFRKQDQYDLVTKNIELLGKMFEKEKTEYDRYTQYVYKLQKFERRWDKSFIQVHLDERGELYISSNYYGAEWLNHFALRVYDDVFQAKTDTVPLDDINNHHSDFLNIHWEKVSYRNGKENGVIQFIADNAERNLKAVFLGKRIYYIVLEKYDKQAIKDALALSVALKRKIAIEKDMKELQSKLN